MAVLDAQNCYASAQTLAASGASTNIIDHSEDRNLGIGTAMAILISVTAIDATSGDETYTVQPQADDNAGFGSPLPIGGLVTILRSIAVPAQIAVPMPPDLSFERFSRLNWTLGGTTPSITYSAYLVPRDFIQNDVIYPKGYTIS